MISKELLVVVDVDRRKTLDEIEFISVPIWVRIMNHPLGMMNEEAGKTIGKELGQFMMVDLEDGDVPIRRFLRVRIRLDIHRPLMRGVTVEEDEGLAELWCPLIHEYLPDFCYVCGIVRHTEKMCAIKLKEGERPQFDKSLRFIPQQGNVDGQRRFGGSRSGAWRSDLAVGHVSSGGSGGRWGSDGSRIDGPSWRRDGGRDGRDDGRKGRFEEEVTSPLKETTKKQEVAGDQNTSAKKELVFSEQPKPALITAPPLELTGDGAGDSGKVVGSVEVQEGGLVLVLIQC